MLPHPARGDCRDLNYVLEMVHLGATQFALEEISQMLKSEGALVRPIRTHHQLPVSFSVLGYSINSSAEYSTRAHKSSTVAALLCIGPIRGHKNPRYYGQSFNLPD